MINVTKTFLPPKKEFENILNQAWESGWITNRGALVLQLEDILKNRFNVGCLIAMTNGTLPLQIAIKALELSGEIITTPFSYVATTSSIIWEGVKPVFVDINPDDLTIDPDQIEQSITEQTSAIMATHVFGNPCDVERIALIAKKHKLKVIYDAAHAFDVNYKGTSIFNYGDVSTCSFHATKLFHTAEGGAIITNDEHLKNKLFYHHNFGHDGPEKFHGVGINAKMSELQAAMGLAILPYLEKIKKERKRVIQYYLDNLSFSNFRTFKLREHTEWNESYFPIIFDSEEALLVTTKKLNAKNIFPRRYFYPSLNTLSFLGESVKKMPVSEKIASSILCLPLYTELNEKELNLIVNTINNTTC